jgi:hypothetical protein
MPMIYVRTKPGRRLFYEGKPIPLDNFVPVADSPMIRRFIDHWGDLEQQGAGDIKSGKSQPAAAAAPTYAKKDS